jgi:predicted deacylase
MLKVTKRLISVTGMSDIVQRRIPVLTLDSKLPGPTVWLAGCIHGDEPGGAVIIHELINAVRKAGIKGGVIHALPLINSMGFENVSRFINSDREDLNRCFPGDAKGTMGERIAGRLFDQIAKTKPELVIDLHNDWIQSVPYVLIEAREAFATAGQRKRAIELAAATGLLIVQEPEASEAMSRTLTGALVAAGITAFTVEAGGACGIVEASIEAGKTAMLGVLRELGMLPDELTHAAPKPSPKRALNFTSRPQCTSSGIVRFSVTPGDEVIADQKVAQVYSAFGSLEETLRAARPGYVLGVADHARAVPGSEIIAIAETATKQPANKKARGRQASKRN